MAVQSLDMQLINGKNLLAGWKMELSKDEAVQFCAFLIILAAYYSTYAI